MKSILIRNLAVVIAGVALFSACGGGGSGPREEQSLPDTGSNSSGTSARAPYLGAPVQVPGSVEAENFDLGGEGIAYHDKNVGNQFAEYRTDEDVDIATTADPEGGSFDVREFESGEWLNYAIEVADTDDYTIELRLSSPDAAGGFNIQVDGEEITGKINVPNTGADDSYVWIGRDNIPLAAGEHALTVQSQGAGITFNRIRVSKTPQAGPYYGAPIQVPGGFEAEDFDLGGEGAAYHDKSTGNSGGEYRADEDVDIIRTTDSAGGEFALSDFETEEWLNYGIEVDKAADYDIELRVASSRDDSAFHIEVDGMDVTGVIAVPDSGETGDFAWIGKSNVPLTTGAHELRIVADGPGLRLNEVRILESAATVPADPEEPTAEPFSGKPSVIPGTLEAEQFDNGGQGLAYNDLDAGNFGGEYRPDEDVDIVLSSDPDGGDFDINRFNTGEWLSYTVDVADTRDYDIELRVASAFADSAVRVEVDGQDVSGAVTVPNTGNWTAYEWLLIENIPLTAGKHVIKVAAEREFFNLNSIRISEEAPAPDPVPDSSARLLFHSGFGGGTELLPPVDCWGTGCWQEIVGLDTSTGFSWPSRLWNGNSRFLMLTDPDEMTGLTLGNWMFNRIDSTTGPSGDQTQVLYQQISKNANGTEPMGPSPAQNELEFQPKEDVRDLYVSFWIKLQPDLVEKMNNLPAGPGISGGGTWRAFFAMKTGGQTAWGSPAGNGDYRIEAYVMTYGGGQPYWSLLGDNTAGGGAPLVNGFNVQNREVPVPVGEWFKFEIFWHRSSESDGRVWMAVDGQVIADRRGPNTGAWDMPVNRIMSPLLYSGSRMPIYQWIDNIEIWDGFPPQGSNPPYAPN